MKETLFSIARANMSAACKLYCVMGDDPREMNIIGYHLQQAAELSLKFILEECGIDYPKTHDIQQLFSSVRALDISSEILSTEIMTNLFMFAGTLTSWEASTRYIKNWFLELDLIRMGQKIINELMRQTAEWSGEAYHAVRFDELKRVDSLRDMRGRGDGNGEMEPEAEE